MKRFYSIIDALREIRDKSQCFKCKHESILLFVDHLQENFYVTEDICDISEKLVQTFLENGCEPDAETLANECVVIEYSLATNKEAYPYLYGKSKKPAFKSEVDLIRKKKEIEPEYSLDFNIG